MDILRKLSLDLTGLEGIIHKYTSDPYITNITKELTTALQNKNVNEIIYLLEIIEEWYSSNQAEIQNNPFVFNKSTHNQMEQKIGEYIDELSNISEVNKSFTIINGLEDRKESVVMRKKLFISHSSKDQVYCNAFVDFLEDIGVPEEEILYTSSSRHGVPGDLDIFQYLRENIAEGATVFYMLSDNYYSSPYCLNEMGAAWVTQNDFSIFFLPNFNGKVRGVIDGARKAYSLSDSIELIEFRNKITKLFNLPSLSETKWESVKNKFLSEISS